MLFAAVAAAVTLAPQLVVMIHGAGGGGWEYDYWKPVFVEAGFEVKAPDLMPAQGGLEATTFSDYVEQVVAWCQEDRSVILVGASMGGVLAIKAAERVNPSALVLVNSVVPDGVVRLPMVSAMPDVVQWKDGPLSDTEAAMPDSDRRTILWAWKKWRNESGAVMNQMFAGIIAKRPSCPSLVVIGEADTDITPKMSRALGRWAGSDVVSYKGMSHVGPLLSKKASWVANDTVAWLLDKQKADGHPVAHLIE